MQSNKPDFGVAIIVNNLFGLLYQKFDRLGQAANGRVGVEHYIRGMLHVFATPLHEADYLCDFTIISDRLRFGQYYTRCLATTGTLQTHVIIIIESMLLSAPHFIPPSTFKHVCSIALLTNPNYQQTDLRRDSHLGYELQRMFHESHLSF